MQFGKNSFVDRGGSIPPSLITATPTERADASYRKAMRAAGREPHPAILPTSVARFGIQLATEVGHVVYDPFSGSGTVPVEAMRLGRRAIASERSREYLEGSLIRARLAGFELEQQAT
jgi:DNA modification methylase